MTYVVHLWEEAAPATLQAADQLHERLAGTPAAANPKFARLARALIERFPAEVGGRGEATASWVESPPDGRTDTRVYSLGLYDEGITELLPVLVAQATALGLTVYDDQAGRAYLPGGQVLDGAGRAVLEPDTVLNTPTVAQARAAFKREVLPSLAAAGFQLTSHNLGLDFIRHRPSGQQKLTVELQALVQALQVKPSTMIYPDLPPGIALAIGPGPRPVPVFARRVSPLEVFAPARAQPDVPRYPEFLAADETQLQALARAYLAHVQALWLPLLDAIAEPPALVQCDRDPAPHEVHFRSSYGMLGMAHWVGAPDFDAIVEAHAGRMAATTMRGLVPVLYGMADKLRALPQYFGIYPRTEPE
jgi:hypothetical protein